ncbi:glycosyltransferase [Caballeronia humi]|uniref:Glycosyl transferase n=1 Tax=Caballeronia humi TaxID=326474 RepID=A0A158IRA7_9BURK|nr:glycosyltransferase [Caballeronia humi]SAL59088.1 glycosyl transferase [Caballeronia humi]
MNQSVPFNGTPLLSLIVPCYNEQEVLPEFMRRVLPVLQALPGMNYELVFVNDGSRDDTLDLLIGIAREHDYVRVVDLSRNFGKEAAMTAGIDEARGDVVVPFDADLQDPPEVIPKLVAKWREGFDVVIARRVDRSSDTYLKRKSASLFYKFHNTISDIDLPENAGDFRLMSRDVVNALQRLTESRRFMKGLFAWVGFKTAIVEYTRQSRAAGKTKFSGWRLWNFALEGVTSFSTLPLRVWTYFGFVTAFAALSYAAFMLIRTLIFGNPVPGYASIVTILLFLGGVQLIGIGVVGEYIGRIYIESKQRPVYLVQARYGIGERAGRGGH